MGLFDWAKKRRANKEIQDTLNDTFGDLTDKEIAQAYKNTGASRKDVEDILTIKHGMTEEFTQDMLDSQTRIVINMLKQYSDMSELQSALNPPFDIKAAISDDMLSYLAVGSLFSFYDNNYERYAVYLLNEIFDYPSGRYSVADLKKCLSKENLNNVFVDGDMTQAGLVQLERECVNKSL